MENQNNQVSLESIENLSYSNFNNVYKELSKHNYKEGYQKRLLAQAIKKTAQREGFSSDEALELANDVTDIDIDVNKHNAKISSRKTSLFSKLNRKYKKEVKEEKQEDQQENVQKESKNVKPFQVRFFGKWLAIVGKLPREQALATIKTEITNQAFAQGLTLEDLNKEVTTLKCVYKNFSKTRPIQPARKLIEVLTQEIYVSAMVATIKKDKHSLNQMLDDMDKDNVNRLDKGTLALLLHDSTKEEAEEIANHPAIQKRFSEDELEDILEQKQAKASFFDDELQEEFKPDEEINDFVEQPETEIDTSNNETKVVHNEDNSKKAEYADMLGIDKGSDYFKSLSLEDMQQMLNQFAMTPHQDNKN